MTQPPLPRRLPNGNLLVPRRAEGDGVIGDGAVEIGPDDPEYAEWLRFLEPPETAPRTAN